MACLIRVMGVSGGSNLDAACTQAVESNLDKSKEHAQGSLATILMILLPVRICRGPTL